jgi:hypothetical protein
MRVVVSRRTICILALMAAGVAAAVSRQQVLEMTAPLAVALSDGDAGAFMKHIPEDLPDRAALQANIEGLLGAAIVTSSVQVLETGETQARLDWYMEIKGRATGTVVERRREPVLLGFRGAKLASIQPVSFFRPPGTVPAQ